MREVGADIARRRLREEATHSSFASALSKGRVADGRVNVESVSPLARAASLARVVPCRCDVFSSSAGVLEKQRTCDVPPWEARVIPKRLGLMASCWSSMAIRVVVCCGVVLGLVGLPKSTRARRKRDPLASLAQAEVARVRVAS